MNTSKSSVVAETNRAAQTNGASQTGAVPPMPQAAQQSTPSKITPTAIPNPSPETAKGTGGLPTSSRTPEKQELLHVTARRHSTRVVALKWAFPICAVLTIGSIGASIAANYLPEIQIALDASLVEDGRVVMKNPRVKGIDRQKRRFELTASRAITDLRKPNEVELESIDAKVPVDDENFADVKAKHGKYDSSNEILILREDVQLAGARGMDIRLQEAKINLKSGSMVSNKPVEVKSDGTDISANALSVEENGAKIVFTDTVRMTITRPVERGVPKQ